MRSMKGCGGGRLNEMSDETHDYFQGLEYEAAQRAYWDEQERKKRSFHKGGGVFLQVEHDPEGGPTTIREKWLITEKLARAGELNRWDAIATTFSAIPNRLINKQEVGLMLIEMHNQHDQIGELIRLIDEARRTLHIPNALSKLYDWRDRVMEIVG